MIFLIIFIPALVLVIITFLFNKQSQKAKIPDGLKDVPLVDGCVPFFGHFFKVSPETLPNYTNCYKKYGKIFKLKFFNKTWVVVCEKEFFKEYYTLKESSLSLFKVFEHLYILPAFHMTESRIMDWMPALKKSMASKVFKGRCPEDTELCRKMAAKAYLVVEELKKEGNGGSGTCLNSITMQYICRIFSPVLFGQEVSTELGARVCSFFDTLTKVTEMAVYFPRFLVKLRYQRTLDMLVSNIASEFRPLIENYRKDESENNSKFLRFLTNFKNPVTNRELCEPEIGKILAFVMFFNCTGSVATSVLVLLDVITRPNVLEKLKEEVSTAVNNGDFETLLDLPFLHACVMETARFRRKCLTAERIPIGLESLAGYYIGDANYLSVAEMLHNTSTNIFPQGNNYSPDDHFDRAGFDVLSWGGGTHNCPGRGISLKMVKILIAILITSIEFDTEKTNVGKMKVFSPSSSAEVEHKFFYKIMFY